MFKQCFSFFLCCALIIAALPFRVFITASAAEIVASGNCGPSEYNEELSTYDYSDTVKYTLYSNGFLTISGNGPMADYYVDSSPFRGSESIRSILIDEGVTSIGYEAFTGCRDFTTVTIADSVTTINDRAFAYCYELTGITIPAAVSVIKDGAFWQCCDIERIEVSDKNQTYHSANNCIIETKTKTLVLSCDNSIIPDDGSVTSIGHSAFDCCGGLQKLTIPTSVIQIDYESLWSLSSVDEIEVSIGNKKYHSSGNCLIETDSKKLIFGCKNSLIPDDGSVTAIGNSAFLGCYGLTEITIPTSVNWIGRSAFSQCRYLTDVTIQGNITSINQWAFWSCDSLTNITLPGSIKWIGGWAFGYCESLDNVTIPGSVISLGDGVFEDCTGLKSITIPPSVTNITDPSSIPEKTHIIGIAGSYAQSWAKENDRSFTPIKGAYVTLKHPEITDDSPIDLAGFATPDTAVTVTANGKKVLTTTASANGEWNGSFTVSGIKKGDKIDISAAVTFDGKTVTDSVALVYPTNRKYLGDVNEDGKILSDDARLALRASAQLEELNASQFITADVNEDYKVLADDARQILRYSARLEHEYYMS